MAAQDLEKIRVSTNLTNDLPTMTDYLSTQHSMGPCNTADLLQPAITQFNSLENLTDKNAFQLFVPNPANAFYASGMVQIDTNNG